MKRFFVIAMALIIASCSTPEPKKQHVVNAMCINSGYVFVNAQLPSDAAYLYAQNDTVVITLIEYKWVVTGFYTGWEPSNGHTAIILPANQDTTWR